MSYVLLCDQCGARLTPPYVAARVRTVTSEPWTWGDSDKTFCHTTCLGTWVAEQENIPAP
jgi:hypothetical protein